MKKFICLILILSILLCGFVPCYAVGESLAISGLGTLASSLGFSSVAPLIGIAGVLVAGGLALTQTNFLSAIKGYLGSFYKPSQLTNLTDLGYTPSTTVSSSVAESTNSYLDLVTSMGLADSVIINNDAGYNLMQLDPDLAINSRTSSIVFNSQTKWFPTPISNLVFTPILNENTYDKGLVVFIFNTLTGDIFYKHTGVYQSGTTIYPYYLENGFSFTLGVDNTNDVKFRFITNAGASSSSSSFGNVSASFITNNTAYFENTFGVTPNRWTTNTYRLTYYPNAGYNTLAGGAGTYAPTIPVLDSSAVPLTDNTVITVPQTWEYNDNEDVLTIPNISGGILRPSDVLNNPDIPSTGTIEWQDTPVIPDDAPDVPDWTFKIPILGTIAKLIQWLGNLLKQLGNWLTSIWDTITGWFADIKQLLLDIFNTLKNLDLSRFVSAVFSFITGYTLYNTLFSAYLPQCIAVVLWAGWLVLMCFWILRLLLNRG